ncbi:MAG TPA: hypothetical protein VGD01_13540 [Candidatus Elarobacter sp.]|jgi:hypothetical protein
MSSTPKESISLELRRQDGRTVVASLDRWSVSGVGCNVELAYEDRVLTVCHDDYFSAMIELRRRLEREGLVPLINAARRDVWASGMAREMGAGLRAYVLVPGRRSNTTHLISIFEPASTEDVGTVDEQERFMHAWVTSLSPRA